MLLRLLSRKRGNGMRMDSPCNLNVPAGATPMTIADAILRECDTETLAEVLYHIDCYMKFHETTEVQAILEGSKNRAESEGME